MSEEINKIYKGMRFFMKDYKYNFVDTNNAFVGYDACQCCCEDADWFIADTITSELPSRNSSPKEVILEWYTFDIKFFKRFDDLDHLDCGQMVVFRLVNEYTNKEKFLHLYNVHNGYYYHGFKFQLNDVIIKEDAI